MTRQSEDQQEAVVNPHNTGHNGAGGSGFAAFAYSPYCDERSGDGSLTVPEASALSDTVSQPVSLPTIHSGDVFKRSQATEPAVKQGKLATFFRLNSKKRLSQPGDASNGDSIEVSATDAAAQRPPISSASPQKAKPRSLFKTPSLVVLQTGGSATSSSPPESPRTSFDSVTTTSTQWPKPGFLLRSKSDFHHRNSASLDARESSQNGALWPSDPAVADSEQPDSRQGRANRVSKLQPQPSVPAALPSQRAPLRSGHKRSASSSQIGSQGMERETQSATGGLMRMLSCVALPKVGNDDGDLISPRAEPAQPTAPLVNPGNLCFFTSMLQCLLYTKGLPYILWSTFPELPELPAYGQHEPLSDLVAPSVAGSSPLQEGGKHGAESASSAESAIGAEAAEQEPLSGSSPRNSEEEEGSVASVVIKQEDKLPASTLLLTSTSSSLAASETGEGNAAGGGLSDDGASGLPQVDPVMPYAACNGANGLSPSSPADSSESSEAAPAASEVPAAAKGAAAGEAHPPAQEGVPPPKEPRTDEKEGTERDLRVWEMSKRAAAVAAAAGDSESVIVRRLALAFAHVMSEMLRGEGRPVNPLPAVYFAAQHSNLGGLINGSQQDVHELWLQLMGLLTDDAHSYPEAGGNLRDIFKGSTNSTSCCRRLNPEDFYDLILQIGQNNCTVEASLADYFLPEDMSEAVCSRCKEQEERQLSSKTTFQKLQGVFSSSQKGKVVRRSFGTLPPALVLQLRRCSTQGSVKINFPIKVNLTLHLRKYTSEAAEPVETRDTEGASPFRAASESSRRKAASGEGARDDSCEYRLFACILHRGEGSNKGHYFAMCRVGPSNDDWYIFDDHRKPEVVATKSRGDKFLSLTEEQKRQVCMMFYERVQPSTPRSRT